MTQTLLTKPKFSIIIPALNEEEYLPHLLQSLVEQTYKDFEVIVVDGKSKDKTVELAKTFQSKLPRLTILKSKHASLPLQRNMGARIAKGEWLVFIDADTVCLPYTLERAHVFIQTRQPAFFTSWGRPDTDESKDALYTLVGNIMLEGGLLFKRPLAPGPFSLVKRSVFDWVGGYDEKASFGEDLDFSLRVYKRGINLELVRESLFVLSLRRARKLGGFKLVTQYAIGALSALFFNKALKDMPGYVMGGHMYDKKGPKASLLDDYEKRLKKFLKDFIG